VGIRTCALVAVLCVSANVAVASRWVVNEGGDCVREWTPSSLARGPLAMTNALTFPVRQLIGGGQTVTQDPSAPTSKRILLVPLLSLLGLGTGTIECLFVMTQGMAEFVTGGAFGLVSDESADLSLAPMTPTFLTPYKPPPATDPCGRPRS
jgi:hypothetical protein